LIDERDGHALDLGRRVDRAEVDLADVHEERDIPDVVPNQVDRAVVHETPRGSDHAGFRLQLLERPLELALGIEFERHVGPGDPSLVLDRVDDCLEFLAVEGD